MTDPVHDLFRDPDAPARFARLLNTRGRRGLRLAVDVAVAAGDSAFVVDHVITTWRRAVGGDVWRDVAVDALVYLAELVVAPALDHIAATGGEDVRARLAAVTDALDAFDDTTTATTTPKEIHPVDTTKADLIAAFEALAEMEGQTVDVTHLETFDTPDGPVTREVTEQLMVGRAYLPSGRPALARLVGDAS
ncbi:MAG: hypothetical protein FWF90_05095 [Promicromonosporaceae bacterium]|nr:hypothetical protein [Promicromonosporaceae bacterium]